MFKLVYLDWRYGKNRRRKNPAAFNARVGDIKVRILLWLLAYVMYREEGGDMRDIPDVKQDDKYYRKFFYDATDAIALADAETGELINVNRAMERLSGWDKSELIGKSQKIFHPPELVYSNVSSSLEQHRSSKENDLIETRIITKSGEIREVEIRSSPMALNGRMALSSIFCDITERKAAEQALLVQKQFMRQVIDSNPNQIHVKDANGTFLLANKTLADAFGLPPEEIVGRKITEVNHFTGEVESYLKADREVIQTRREVRTTEQSSMGGQLRWFLSIKKPLELPDGTLNVLGISVDITEQRKYQERLHNSNELMERIFANIRTLIAYMDADFNFFRVNQAYANADGHPPEYYVGKNHFELFPNAENEAIFREVVASGQPYTVYAKPFVYEYNQERGVTYWDWNIQPIKNQEGQIIGLVLSLLDRTEEKRAEERLRLYGRALEASINSIVIVDAARPELPLIYVNPAFTSITGYSAEEALGRNLRFLQGDDREQPELENIRCAVRERRDGQAVLRNYRKDGSLFWSELYVSPVWNDLGELTHFIGVARDVTQRRKAEQDMEESRTQLRGLMASRENAREEERKRIAREIHDELGQILSVLKLKLSVLVHKYAAKNPLLHEHINELMALAVSALGVTRDIASALRPATLDMGIVSALEWLADRFGSNTGIQCETRITDHEIQLEENQAIALFRIVQESLTNVARHAKTERVVISLDRDTDDHILKIRDYGVGFDTSIQGARSFGLIGLRERAMMLAGTVFINSRPGNGTEIVVRIPINNNSRKS